MNKQKVDDLLSAFRKIQGQLQTTENLNEKKRTRKNHTSEKYSRFLELYHDLENNYNKFKTMDLCFFFREKANEAGAKYVIANMKRDMGIFKKLQESFEIPEILLMIEFIFSGDQNYLDLNRTQPTVLASSYVNTIYQDSVAWANDEYVPKEQRVHRSRIDKREWKKSDTNKFKIGEWD